MSEATIVAMITVGSYQGLCNIWRVATFDPADLPVKVGAACRRQQCCSQWGVACGFYMMKQGTAPDVIHSHGKECAVS
jgi:hypothetical protein